MTSMPVPFAPANPAMIVGHSIGDSPPPLGLGEPFALLGGDRLGPGGISFDLMHEWQSNFLDAVIDACESHLAAERPWFRMPPTALIGRAGCGRTHAARMLATVSGLPHIIVNVADPVTAMSLSASDEINEALWVSPVVTAIAAARCANPIVTVVNAEHNADAAMALIAMLDPVLGRAWQEDRIATTVDLGEVTWLVQASDAAALPEPLADRLAIVPMRWCGVARDSTQALSLLLEVLGDLGVARDDPAVDWQHIFSSLTWQGFSSPANAYADLRGIVIEAKYEHALATRQPATTSDSDPY